MIKHARSTQSDKFPIYLQYLRKEVKNEVYFLHADKHQKFLQVGIAGFDRSGQICPSTKNRKLIISLQNIKKIVSQLLLCSIVMLNIQIFYGGSVMFIVSCFFAQPDCRDFLPEHCTTIIKEQLCRRSFHLCCLCSKLTFFKRSRVYCSKSNYDHQTSHKKVCIRLCDTNNSTQCLTWMYHHIATEILYRLRGTKISLTPWCPINLALFIFPSVCDGGSPDHQGFFFNFPP